MFKCIVRLCFFVHCLPRRSLCVSETLTFHKKDILKYLCLNYSHVSSCSCYECDSCVHARSRTHVCKQVYTCMFNVFRLEQKAMGMAKRIRAKGRDFLGVCDWHTNESISILKQISIGWNHDRSLVKCVWNLTL